MAAPQMASMTATQLAEQKVKQEQQNPQAKQTPSKFDQTMVNKAQDAQAPQKAQAAQAAQQAQAAQAAAQVQQTQRVQEVAKTDGIRLNKLATALSQPNSPKALDPVQGKQETSKAVTMMSNMVSDMEKGQGTLDKLINAGLHGLKFSNTELLGLQAGMYKYSQELDLTGKVVDKATSALKEALKTQV